MRNGKAATNGHRAPPAAVNLAARRAQERTAGARKGGCPKCGSLFIVLEPAFVHCRYCGSLTRLAGGSMLAQELFELRSGLRLAS